MTTHSLTEDDQQPLIALLKINNDHSYSYIRPTTTTDSLTREHQKPLIILKRAITNHPLPSEGHQRQLIALQRTINDQALPYRGPSTTTHSLT